MSVRTRGRRLLMIGIGLALAAGATPAAAQERSDSQSGWEPVQAIDNRDVDLNDTVMSRAGTSVVLWSVNGGAGEDRVYTSVRRVGDQVWSERESLPGGPYAVCAPRGAYAVKDCAQLVTAGSDDIVLFAARETDPQAPQHVLTVQRLDGSEWMPLDDIAVPAPIDQVQGTINDEGDTAVVWLDDPQTLGGVSSAQGGPWEALPSLNLAEKNYAINHVQLRNDDAVVAVIHAVRPTDHRVSYKVATLVDGSWTVDPVRPKKSWRSSPPAIASAPSGALVVGWAEGQPDGFKEQLVVRVRAAGASSFGAKTRLSTAWPCDTAYSYCVTFAVLDNGKVAGLWYDHFTGSKAYGSTYDPATDAWAPPTRLAGGYVRAFYDVHPDGTVVMSDGPRAWTCHDVVDCTRVGSPAFFPRPHGVIYRDYEAGPAGSAVGFAQLQGRGKIHASALIEGGPGLEG